MKRKKENTIKIVYVSESTGEEVAAVDFTQEEFSQIKKRAADLEMTIEDYFDQVMRIYLETNE